MGLKLRFGLCLRLGICLDLRKSRVGSKKKQTIEDDKTHKMTCIWVWLLSTGDALKHYWTFSSEYKVLNRSHFLKFNPPKIDAATALISQQHSLCCCMIHRRAILVKFPPQIDISNPSELRFGTAALQARIYLTVLEELLCRKQGMAGDFLEFCVLKFYFVMNINS